MATATAKLITSINPLKPQNDVMSPFLFCVYHKDDYPAGNDRMECPRHGNGMDFNPSAPYRMYHGERIPGFPQHPHRGFETLTATMSGLVDHTDSLGNGGRYGNGDLQWMTAGKGIVHGENFPLLSKENNNPTRFFQLWLNLPKKDKLVDPSFVMHWSENIPRWTTPDGLTKLTLFAGELEDKKGLAPPPRSYAVDPEHDVGVYFIQLSPGGKCTLPAAKGGATTNRGLYYVEGNALSVSGQAIHRNSVITVDASKELVLQNTNTAKDAPVSEVLVLQGKPINEPIAQRGPFVMNAESEIFQAYADYQQTGFGGWPWKEDAVVFPREKGRFALLNGVEYTPPSATEGSK